ncbi:MAG TPA: YggS family pyridoxal phosphate-dependent enzyme [Candidatus Baltobacteraceae bacterium]|nr:YggS family pyridoxal phosphate-dependent enzyme [Candidatus Baltobacteraceae bacterium]
METIAQRYARLRALVPSHVRIVAVTKFQPLESVIEAVEAGVSDVGENYVQEARRKYDANGLPKPVTKHFIGHIQTNKAKAIAATFDAVQSVDRPEAAEALAKAAESLGKRLPVLLQVNISPSERYGCLPDQAERLAEAIRARTSLRLDGVMAIGPITKDRTEMARAFQLAAEAFARVGGDTFSIGMSGDWEEAVRAGSTMIRVGTTIFGPRPARPVSKNAVM